MRCRRHFLRFFPHGFTDERYLSWERDYKAEAHTRWTAELSVKKFVRLLAAREYHAIALEALRIEARTNLLFSFEKMAVRDAVRNAPGARRLAEGLYAWLHGPGSVESRFGAWCEAIAGLPRRQTRVLTWPVVTVFGFLAQPDRHMFLKPNVTRLGTASSFITGRGRTGPPIQSCWISRRPWSSTNAISVRAISSMSSRFCGSKALRSTKAAASGLYGRPASQPFRSASSLWPCARTPSPSALRSHPRRRAPVPHPNALHRPRSD